jgi:hypothetical protein
MPAAVLYGKIHPCPCGYLLSFFEAVSVQPNCCRAPAALLLTVQEASKTITLEIVEINRDWKIKVR